mmetsp:Transcript_17623/g.39483  ORF Transcript_17623/g.39483 Transcript_17623/m.39483 type:complete len:236 (+) Transcript_17623:465-1172(+)
MQAAFRGHVGRTWVTVGSGRRQHDNDGVQRRMRDRADGGDDRVDGTLFSFHGVHPRDVRCGEPRGLLFVPEPFRVLSRRHLRLLLPLGHDRHLRHLRAHGPQKVCSDGRSRAGGEAGLDVRLTLLAGRRPHRARRADIPHENRFWRPRGHHLRCGPDGRLRFHLRCDRGDSEAAHVHRAADDAEEQHGHTGWRDRIPPHPLLLRLAMGEESAGAPGVCRHRCRGHADKETDVDAR